MSSVKQRIIRLEAKAFGGNAGGSYDPARMTDADLIASIRAYVTSINPAAKWEFRAFCIRFGATADELRAFGFGEDITP